MVRLSQFGNAEVPDDDLAQLFSTNAFSVNVLTTFTAIYSQSIVNTNNFFTDSYQIEQIPQK